MNHLKLLSATGATLLLAVACSNETYDNVPVDVLYTSDATADFTVTLADQEDYHVSQFGIAIGHTRIELCPETETAQRWNPLRLLAMPIAHAHSPSTPTSSGIPVILSTLDQDADSAAFQDLVDAALRPVRGVDVCAVEVELHHSDDDAHMLENFPEIEDCSVAAVINDTLVCNAEEPVVRFPVDPPLHMDKDVQFRITLQNDAWQTNLNAIAFEELSDVDALLTELQHAAMDAITFSYAQSSE